MKKTLLATALAVGFAGAAAAQTSVTLYGVVDGGIGYTQYKLKGASAASARAAGFSDKATKTGLENGSQQGNRWGLRGSEDLGGGLRAVFKLESGWWLADGTSRGGLFGREAWLGLESDAWGSLKIGRQYNFSDSYFVGLPQGTAFKLGAGDNTFTSASLRRDNMITYETPSFSGFQMGVGYSFQASGAQPWDIKGSPDTDQTAFTSGLRYTNGPLAVAATYDILNKRDNVPGEKDVKSWILSASYDFDVVRLHLAFGQDKDGVMGDRSVPGAVDTAFGGTINQAEGYIPFGYKTNNYGLGVTVPLQSSEFRLGWQSARLGSSLYRTGVELADGKKTQNIYTAIYTYDLSKRTNLYAYANYATGYAFENMRATQFVAGLRHRF